MTCSGPCGGCRDQPCPLASCSPSCVVGGIASSVDGTKAHEAIVGDGELEGRGTGRVDEGRAVLLDETEDAEDPAHPRFALAAVDGHAQ